MSGGKTVAQPHPDATVRVAFVSMGELAEQLLSGATIWDLSCWTLREKDAFAAGHIPQQHLPQGQLELRVNKELPDPTRRILVCCEFGQISTLAAGALCLHGRRLAERVNRNDLEFDPAGWLWPREKEAFAGWPGYQGLARHRLAAHGQL